MSLVGTISISDVRMLPRGYTVIANETEVVAYCLYFPGNDELLDTEAFNWSAGHLQARQAHFHLMTQMNAPRLWRSRRKRSISSNDPILNERFSHDRQRLFR